MDNMSIGTKFVSSIISKIISKKLAKKLNADGIQVNVESADVKFDGNIGTFSIVINGTFTQDDITQITKMLL